MKWYWYNAEDMLIRVIGILGTVFLICVAVLGTIDSVQSLRAQPAFVTCRSQQMEPLRYTLTDSVVCVPFPMRRDTLALQEAP